MLVKVKSKYIRIAPRKVRLVADMVRGQKVKEAKSILNFTVNRSALPVLKLLNSGVASAKNEFKWGESNLYISKITVDEGPKLKRWMPRARGSASPIQKKTSHITIVLEELQKSNQIKKDKKDKVSTKKIGSLDEIKEEINLSENKKNERIDKENKARSLKDKNVKSKIFRRKSI